MVITVPDGSFFFCVCAFRVTGVRLGALHNRGEIGHEIGAPKMLLHLKNSFLPPSTHLDGECRNTGTESVPHNKASAGVI